MPPLICSHLHTANLEMKSPNTIDPQAITAIYVAISPFSQTADLFDISSDTINTNIPNINTLAIMATSLIQHLVLLSNRGGQNFQLHVLVFAEYPAGIGTTLLAMGHLLHVFAAFSPQCMDHFT